jgi:hypothetical protein
LLPFAVEEAQVTQSFSSWISGLWFRPNALKQLAQLGKVQGVYIPHWTFDSLTESFWSAESGTHYYETESYTDSEGNQQTRRVRKTRWRHVTGRYSSFFDDCLVHASKGVDAGLMRKIYPYETAALVSYDPRFLAGWAAEDYQREMSDCWPDAKNYMDGEIRSGCIRQIPGDTHRGLRIKSSYLNRTYKLCLLPVWIAVYRYSGEVYPCLVNGQTGEIHGKAPLSVVKIIMAVLFVLALIAGVYFGFGRP